MKRARKIGVVILLLLFHATVFSQQLKLGDNPSIIERSALLELLSNDQGLLLPRISDTSLINILTPPDGMVIYFTPTTQIMIHANGYWQGLAIAGSGVTSLNGNTGSLIMDTSYISNFYIKVRNEISLTTTGSSGSATYNNAIGVLNVPTYTLAGLGGISLSSLSGTAPITYNSGTGAIGITQATTSTNGYLSSADWNIFNSKLSFYTETDPVVTAINGIVKSNGTTISAAVAGTDYLAPFGSQTAKYFYAAPNGSAGVPTFRAIVASDIPTLNQNTTGSAATLTTGRTISITGDLSYTSPAFNGSGNVTAAGTLATVNANVGSFTAANITVNAKGLITAASNGTFDTTNIANFSTKVRSELSAGTGISYNNGTGVITNSGVVSVNGNTGALTMDTSYIPNFYTKVRNEISLTTTGNSGSASYNNTLGVLNVPTYTLAGLGGISLSSLSGTAPITYNSGTGVIGITQANTSTNGYLSSADWNTFNNKQAALTFSTGLTNTANTITNNLSTGISASNQNVYGSISASGTLTLNSTTNATKGKILFGTSGYDENQNYLGVGTNTPINRLTIGNSAGYEAISRDVRTGSLEIMGGTSEATGAYFQVTGDQNSTNSPYEGSAEFVIRNLTRSQFTLWSYDGASTWTQRMQLSGATGNIWWAPNGGVVGVGLPIATTPTALLHLAGGTSSAGTAPLKLTAGTNLTTPEDGAIEYNGTHYYATIGSTRYQLDQQTGSIDTSNIPNFYLKVRSELSGTAPITYNSSTGAIGITQATTSTNGYLSSADWNTFNNKQSTFGSQTANYFYAAPNGSAGVPSFRAIVAADIPTLNQNTTGSAATLTTGRTISITGDISYTSPAFNGSANVTAAGTLATVNANVGSFTVANITVNAKGLITAASNGTFDTTNIANFYTKVRSELSGTAPITYNSGTGVIGIAQATTSTNGYLSSTDWNTFNNKSAALTFSTGLTNTANTITANLSTGKAGGQSAIGGTASGDDLTLSSTTNATKGNIYFGTSTYDEVNNKLDIGTTTSQQRITIGSTNAEGISRDVRTGSLVIWGGTSSQTGAYFNITGDQDATSPYEGSAEFVIRNLPRSQFTLWSYDGVSTYTPRMKYIGSSGNTYLGLFGGEVRIGDTTTSPTALLHLAPGTSTANTAPLKFSSGTNLTTTEAGAIEYNGTHLYFTATNGGTRYQLDQQTGSIDTSSIPNFYLKVRSELSGTAPITYNSSTGAIGITQSTTSTDGYLSSADWNTFNNKADTVSPTFTGITTINSLNLGLQIIATSGGTTTLTNSSPYYTVFTGSSAQSIVLPNATTLAVGEVYVIENNSTLAVTAKTNLGATIWTIAATAELRVILLTNGTAAGTWQIDYLGGNYATGKLFTVNNTLTFNGTDNTTMTFPTTSKTIAANDGSNWIITGQATGDIPVASSTTAYGKLADVATGSVLISGGVGALPSWSTSIPSTTTATTQPKGTNNTTIATTAFVLANSQPLNSTFTTLTPGATVTWTPTTTSNVYTLVPGGAETINMGAIPAGSVGQYITLVITTSGTTTFNITFGTNIRYQTSTLATGTTSAKKYVIQYLIESAISVLEMSRTTAL